MKRGIFLLILVWVIGSTQTIEAQLFDRIKNKINKKIEDKVEEKTDEVLNGKKKKKEKKVTPKREPTNAPQTEESFPENSENSLEPEQSPELWNKYDFLVADRIFFYDDINLEEYGEFPTKWNLAFGNAEIARLGTDKVIQFKNANTGSAIYPLIEKEDYIEGYTTIEFDLYLDEEFYDNIHTDWEFGFHDISNETNIYGENYTDGDGIPRRNHTDGGKIKLRYSNNSIEVSMGGKYSSSIPKEQLLSPIGWHHISMSFNKKTFKFYLDQHKMLNAPQVVFNPFKFYVYADARDNSKMTLKNVKLAQGGGSIYKQISTDGKYVTNGILFDSGKSTLKPESYGVIKKLVDVFMDHPDWKINIIGHTDSDGDEAFNVKLSSKRAEAVKAVLVERGISSENITTDGKGESAPLNANASPMDKANNRRVEFVKI